MMTRKEDWLARLHNAIETGRLIPFTYGLHDCCLFAAHCIDAMCDTQLVKEINERVNYSDESGANAAIEAAGGLMEAVSGYLGEPVSAKLAAPGDVVLVRDGEDVPVVGVMVGHQIMVVAKGGLDALPFANGVVCWKI